MSASTTHVKFNILAPGPRKPVNMIFNISRYSLPIPCATHCLYSSFSLEAILAVELSLIPSAQDLLYNHLFQLQAVPSSYSFIQSGRSCQAPALAEQYLEKCIVTSKPISTTTKSTIVTLFIPLRIARIDSFVRG